MPSEPTKRSAEKAARHESKGDELLAKGKFEKALARYRKALELDPDRPGIFDKLIAARDQAGGDWKMRDFAEFVSWTMQQQAQEHPEVRQLHAQLSPEWQHAMELVARILGSEGEPASDAVEELVRMGPIATRALLSVLLDLKHAAVAPPEEPVQTPEDQEPPTP
jgi:hypothetical protein